VSPSSCSLGVRSLCGALSASPPPTPFSGPTPLGEGESFRAVGRLSWGSCSHERHYVGCPSFFTGTARGPRRRARIARPSPEPSSGFLPLSTVLALSSRHARNPCESRRSPWPPTLRGLVPCRSRPWNVPSELSLPEEPFPLSRAVASLRVRIRSPPARCHQVLRDRFHRGASSFAPGPPGGGPWTHEPGLRLPRDH